MELRYYQVAGKAKAIKYKGFGLFMEQRTGKTPVACEVIEDRQPQRLLVACPNIAIGVWEAHLAQYQLPNTEIQIVNWESLWSQRKKLKKWNPDFVVADELHRAKNRQSHQSKALRGIAAKSTWRMGLTGTPIESEGKLEQVWALMDFLDPSVFGEWADFKLRYLKYGGFMGKKVIGYKDVDDLWAKFKSRFYRVLLEEVKEKKTDIAPPHLVRFDLEESKIHYETMENQFLVSLNKWIRVRRIMPDGSSKFIRKRKRIIAPRVITQAMKLHQLSGGFILDEDKVVHRFGDEKMAHCGALLMALGNVPVVIIVRFIPELYRLARLCKAMGRTVTLISGDHEFNGFDTDVAIVQIRSGIAIDLSRAEELIFYSWGHSYIDYDQALFRIRSYTSTRARYHYLIAKGTVDEVLYETVTGKKSFVKTYIDTYRR